MDALPAVVVAPPVGLGGVQADPHRRGEPVRPAVLGQRPLHRHRALDGPASRVERDEEPVSGGVDHLPAVPEEQRAKGVVVPPQEVLPGLVPHRLGQDGGPNDVGEHERLRGGDAGSAFGGSADGSGHLRLVPDGSQPVELRSGRLQLQVGLLVLVQRAERGGQDHSRPGHVERRAHLLPVADGRAQFLGRRFGVPVGQQHPSHASCFVACRAGDSNTPVSSDSSSAAVQNALSFGIANSENTCIAQ